METNKIIIFFTENNKLFGSVQSALTGVVLQRAKTIKEIEKISKAVNISGVIVHIASRNTWHVFELLRIDFPNLPIYAMLAPAVLENAELENAEDFKELAKTKKADAIFGEKDIKELAVVIGEKLFADTTDESNYSPSDFFGDDFVRPNFIQLMKRELLANQNQGKKGDWREWQPDKLFMVAEINWHLAKLVQALHRGDAAKVSEYSADVANYMMKTDELFGEKCK